MNKTPWNEAEEKRLLDNIKAGLTIKDAAQLMGRTYRSVERKLFKLRLAGKSATTYPKKPNDTADAAKPAEPKDDPTKVKFWRDRTKELEREVVRLEKVKMAQEVIAEEFLAHAPAAYAPPPFKKPDHGTSKKHGSPQSAVLMLSDSHIGQVVTPEQTNGLGNYNFEIFLRRLRRLERSIFSILQDHTSTAVSEIVIAALGDMIHGNLQHSVEAGQTSTLFDQFYSASHVFAQFIRNLSSLAPVRVFTCPGNHARWGTQKKSPTDNTYSNLDTFLYAHIQALLRDLPNVQVNLDKQFFTKFEVQGWNFTATHGTHLRGGDRTLGIPAHAIGRQISAQAQLSARAGKPLPAFYLVGHLHRPITLPHTLGEFLVNGSWAGIDGFGLAEAFNSSRPSQKFFLLHPKFGRSATYDLLLDHGDDTPHGYTLPEGFCCR